MTSQGTSLLRQQPTAISPADTVRERNAKTTWTGTFSDPSLTSAASTDHAHSVFTSSGSPYSIQELSTQSGILNTKTGDIRSFLRQMELCLTASPKKYWQLDAIGLSGPTGKITLTMIAVDSFAESDSSAFWSKKPLRKNSKSGKRSRGSK